MKILIKLNRNTIIFKIKRALNDEQKNILNTNVISDSELVFSDEYIYQNLKIVTSFINNLINNSDIDTVIIHNNKVVLELLDIIKNTNSIKHIILKDDVPITYKMCEKISKIKHIETLSCFSIQDFLVDFLDKKNITVESRCEILFTSDFMTLNSLNKYSSIYYKKTINLALPLSDSDIDDFEGFLNINFYLKVIHINKTLKSDLENVIDLLCKYRKKNIRIVLHENINDLELVNYIKKVNTSKKKQKIKITISYSDQYLRKNFLPQANINILKLCLLFIFIIIGGSFGYVITNNYVAYQKDVSIKEDLNDIIKSTEDTKEVQDIIEKIEIEEEKKVINDYIASLKTLNTDSVGWLKVPNTSVDYPIVKGSDNDYYLDHNIKHESDFNGWIFMDYRNNTDFSHDNTLIYGHTNYNANVMFGSLKQTLKELWYTNTDNHIITVDSLYENLEYQIFSIYSIRATNDYLNIQYTNILEKLEFFHKLEERSIYDFNVELDHDDQIITLSTCDDGGVNRLVIHAVLLNEEN